MVIAGMFVSCFLGCIVGCLVSCLLRLAFSKENNLTIKTKYFTEKYGELKMVKRNEKGDLIDLYAAKDVDLKAGEQKKIPLGVGMALPKGYGAHLYSRSSTAKNFGIAMDNSVGIIDNCYRGDGDEWQYPAIALRDTHISKGDKICQFRIVKNQPDFEFIPVEHLGDTDRGGFGSTGRA